MKTPLQDKLGRGMWFRGCGELGPANGHGTAPQEGNAESDNDVIISGQKSVYIARHMRGSSVILTSSTTAKDLRRRLRSRGCVEVRQHGSHVRVQCGRCVTTVPVHPGEDIAPGLVRRIERDLESCLGDGWLRGRDHVSREVRAR